MVIFERELKESQMLGMFTGAICGFLIEFIRQKEVGYRPAYRDDSYEQHADSSNLNFDSDSEIDSSDNFYGQEPERLSVRPGCYNTMFDDDEEQTNLINFQNNSKPRGSADSAAKKEIPMATYDNLVLNSDSDEDEDEDLGTFVDIQD